MNPLSGGSPKTPWNKQDIIILLLAVQIVISLIMWVDLHRSGTQGAPASTEQTGTGDHISPPPVVKTESEGTASPLENPPIDPFKEQLDVIRVQILNGCGVPGLAAKARTWMEHNGYDVRDVGNADRQDYGTSQILVRTGNNTAASILASKIGITAGNIKKVKASVGLEVDLTVVLGGDYKRLNFGK